MKARHRTTRRPLMLALIAAMTTNGVRAYSPLRVLGIQINPVLGDVEANLEHAELLIRMNPGYALYVLPELSCTGYDDTVLSSLATFAQEAETGSIADHFRRVASDMNAHVCYGFVRRIRDGRYSICQAVMAPNGVLALTYDKMHLCDMGACSEVAHGLSPGAAPGVFTCQGCRVGVAVCYDLRFPELFRRLAWDENCDLIVHPSAFVRDATFPTYHQFATARAVENGVFLLSINYAGPLFGKSIAVPPWVGPVPGRGELATVSLGTEEGLLPVTVEPADLEAVRAAYPYRRNVNLVLRRRLPTGRAAGS